MVDEEWKEKIDALQQEMDALTRAVSNLQITLHKLHWGDEGLRSLVQGIRYLSGNLEDLTNVIKSKSNF